MRTFLLFGAILLLSKGILSQDPCFELLGDYDIRCAAEETQTLWLGTTESGLLAFDKAEQSFVEYNTGNSNLGENMVRSLLFYQEDLLISTDSSLYLFDNGNFLVYNDSLAGELLLHEGRLIIGGNLSYYELEDDLVVYEKDLSEEVVFSCGFCEQTTDMIIDNQGNIWLTHFGFYEFDILEYDGTDWILHDQSTVSPDIFPVESWNENNRLSVYEGQVLATSWAGLMTFENNEWDLVHTGADMTIIEGPDTLLAPAAIAPDQNMGFWVGAMQNWQTMQSGKVAYFNGADYEVYQPDLPGTTDFKRFYPSSDPQYIYAATNVGLVVIDKACMDDNRIADEWISEVQIYPVPAREVLNFSERIWGEVRICDSYGKLVMVEGLNGESSMDIQQLPMGFFVVQIPGNIHPVNLPLWVK